LTTPSGGLTLESGQSTEGDALKARSLCIGLAVGTIAALAPASASAAPHYYLSLGDSLAQGVQPNAAGTSVETNQGYPDQLYATLKVKYPGLQLVKLGCPGESTTSMITGKGNAAATVAGCKPAGGTQLKAALSFLRKHHKRGAVPLITIDIGANDVDGCVQNGNLDATCLTNGENSISTNEPLIAKRLRAAAPKGTKIFTMTLYDPFLAGYLQGGTPKILAEASVSLAKTINGNIASAYRFKNGGVADVAAAFRTYDLTDMAALSGQSVPVDVAQICTLTWICAAPPQGPNIHANQIGYALIAKTFADAVGNLKLH
jgi:lysophospholipase L1-like esterase